MRPSRSKAALCTCLMLFAPAMSLSMAGHLAFLPHDHETFDHDRAAAATHGHHHDDDEQDHEHHAIRQPVRSPVAILLPALMPSPAKAPGGALFVAAAARPAFARVRPPLLI